MQLAEVAVPGDLFGQILSRIRQLSPVRTSNQHRVGRIAQQPLVLTARGVRLRLGCVSRPVRETLQGSCHRRTGVCGGFPTGEEGARRLTGEPSDVLGRYLARTTSAVS